MKVIETDTAEVQVNSAGTTSHVNGYKIMDMLGEGTFSKVYICRNEAGNEFALKVINKSILKRKREYKRVDGKLVLSNAFQKVQKEVAIMKKLAHSNLVRLYEVIDSPADDKLFLVLELIRGGQIMYWDDKKFRYFARDSSTGVLDKETVRRCIHDVVAALDFLHGNHICHRDIKPENILLSGDEFKLADFGVAYMNEDDPMAAAKSSDAATLRLRSTEGTYHFLAPECTTGEEYDPYQVDVWALGVTMCTLLLGALPFGTGVASLSDVMTSIREDPLVLPPELDTECAELLTRLMEKNPRKRITVPQLKTHSWITGSGDNTGNIRRIPSNPEVVVTQQEIEAAFTPVNNFILMTKLKMKMSSRLTKARKSLAGHGVRAEAVPVTNHIPVPLTEPTGKSDGDKRLEEPKTMEMAPGEHSMTDRLQRRSSRLADTIGSITTTLTRRKGAVSPVFDSAVHPASHVIAANESPSKAEATSRHNSQSTQVLITPTDATRGGNTGRLEGILTDEARKDELSNAIDSLPSRGDTTSADGDKSPGRAETSTLPRMIKRKSGSFQGFIQMEELAKGLTESDSSTSKRKRGGSLSRKGDTNDNSSVFSASDTVSSIDPGQNDTSTSKLATNSSPPDVLSRRMSRRDSMSFRALIVTSGLPADIDGTMTTGDKTRSDATAMITGLSRAGGNEVAPTEALNLPNTSETTRRRATLSQRLSRRNSRSIRALNILTIDASQSRQGPTGGETLSSNLTQEDSLTTLEVNAAESSDDNPFKDSKSPNKLDATNPSIRLPWASSFRPPMPEEPLATAERERGRSASEAGNKQPSPVKESSEAASPVSHTVGSSTAHSIVNVPSSKLRAGSPPGLLSGRLSQGSSISFRVPEATSYDADCSSVATANASNSPATVSPLAEVSDTLPDNPKLKVVVHAVEQPQHSLRKSSLPALDMHLSPISSPATSPVASPRAAADLCQQESCEDEVTPRKRSSSPSKAIGSARRLSNLKVSPVARRSSNLKLTGLPGPKQGDNSQGSKADQDTSTDSANPSSPAEASSTQSLLPGQATHPTEEPVARSDSASRSATFTCKPASADPERRKLQWNRSVSSGNYPSADLTRQTSLAKALDEYLTSIEAAGQSPQKPSSPATAASPEIETLAMPKSPTKRHQVHVPPLLHSVDQAGAQVKEDPPRLEDEVEQRRRHTTLGAVLKPGAIDHSPTVDLGTKSPPVLESEHPRRRSLVDAQDSLRLLFSEKKHQEAQLAGRKAPSKPPNRHPHQGEVHPVESLQHHVENDKVEM